MIANQPKFPRPPRLGSGFKDNSNLESIFKNKKRVVNMVKLSELKDDEMLIVDMGSYGQVISKEDYLNEIEEHRGCKVYTSNKYKASIDAYDMLESAIECEYQNMYEDWDIEIKQDITKEDIKDIQVVLDRVLSRSDNISYTEKEQVKIDM